MNLITNLRTIIETEFQAIGKSLTAADINEMLYQFFNTFINKRVIAKPRSILTSAEVEQKKSSNPIWLQDFTEIVRKIENGEDINEHLSKLSVKTQYNDLMLNDWGIHHIHLSTTKKSPQQKFYNRSGFLLLVFFQDNVAYLIDVLPHPEHQEIVFWSQKEFMQVINNNWAELLQKWQLRGILGLERTISDTERSQLRGVHVNSLIQLDDKIFLGPGGGITAAGTSMEIQRSCDYLLENLENLQTVDDVQEVIEKKDGTRTEDTDFRLMFEDGQFYITGFESGIKIRVAH